MSNDRVRYMMHEMVYRNEMTIKEMFDAARRGDVRALRAILPDGERTSNLPNMLENAWDACELNMLHVLRRLQSELARTVDILEFPGADSMEAIVSAWWISTISDVCEQLGQSLFLAGGSENMRLDIGLLDALDADTDSD